MKPKVIIYTTQTCSQCGQLKEYLKEKKVDFAEVDLVKHPEKIDEVMKLAGQVCVPITIVDDKVIVGFDKDKLDELFG